MQRAHIGFIRAAGHNNLAVFHCNGDQRGEAALQRRLSGPLQLTSTPLMSTCTPAGTVTGKRPIRDTVTSYLGYQTLHRISPPTPSWRARCPVMTPLGVERMAIPIPESTQGISCFWVYTRRPGRLTRSKPVMTGWRWRRSPTYFSVTRRRLVATGFQPSPLHKLSMITFFFQDPGNFDLDFGTRHRHHRTVRSGRHSGCESTYQQ